MAKSKEKMRDMVDWWIDGSIVIKKCNLEPHLGSSVYNLAVQWLREKRAVSSDYAYFWPPADGRSSSNVNDASIIRLYEN